MARLEWGQEKGKPIPSFRPHSSSGSGSPQKGLALPLSEQNPALLSSHAHFGGFLEMTGKSPQGTIVRRTTKPILCPVTTTRVEMAVQEMIKSDVAHACRPRAQ